MANVVHKMPDVVGLTCEQVTKGWHRSAIDASVNAAINIDGSATTVQYFGREVCGRGRLAPCVLIDLLSLFLRETLQLGKKLGIQPFDLPFPVNAVTLDGLAFVQSRRRVVNRFFAAKDTQTPRRQSGKRRKSTVPSSC